MTKFIARDEFNNEREAFSLFNIKINDIEYLVYYINRQGNLYNIFASKKDQNKYINIIEFEKLKIRDLMKEVIKSNNYEDIKESDNIDIINFNIKDSYIVTTNKTNIDKIANYLDLLNNYQEETTYIPHLDLNLQEDIVQRVNEEEDFITKIEATSIETIESSFDNITDLNNLDYIIDKIKNNITPKVDTPNPSYGFSSYKVLALISVLALFLSAIFLGLEISLFK